MNPEAGSAWFRAAAFITLTAAGLMIFQRPGTAEFVVTVTTLVIGMAFIALIAWIVRKGSH
ncbi:MAG: hypothetical protein HY259_07330 [Chloroflexi bacterium]|nr:hypothetical protein [Chloroflexota bacterium]MBI3733257.1 hypothetical protein [Chloroflexota bacterium]